MLRRQCCSQCFQAFKRLIFKYLVTLSYNTSGYQTNFLLFMPKAYTRASYRGNFQYTELIRKRNRLSLSPVRSVATKNTPTRSLSTPPIDRSQPWLPSFHLNRSLFHMVQPRPHIFSTFNGGVLSYQLKYMIFQCQLSKVYLISLVKLPPILQNIFKRFQMFVIYRVLQNIMFLFRFQLHP